MTWTSRPSILHVDGTEVTLSGQVPTLWVKTLAIDRMLEIDGVETVASELVIPGVEDDDEIARAVGSAIQTYQYNTIWDYVEGSVTGRSRQADRERHTRA